VRAGDILTLFNLYYGFTVPQASYYIQAAKYLTVNVTTPVQFIVTTDSLSWAKKHIALEAVYRNRSNTSVVYSEGHSVGFDMALLASCDALILSTGSYGWWAAWLANRTTIYYRYWPRPASYISTIFTHEDYFPPQWIGMGNQSDLTVAWWRNRRRRTCDQEIVGSTPGRVASKWSLVTTWMGDCLRTGKPSRYNQPPRTTQPSIPS